MKVSLSLLCLIVNLLSSCAPDSSSQSSKLELRNMSLQENLEDFEQMVSAFRSFYGPLEYKEKRFDFSFDKWVNYCKEELRSARNDAEAVGVYQKFLAKFQDAHVGMRPFRYRGSVTTYSIPIFLTPLLNEDGETKAYAAIVDKRLKSRGVQVYDELVAVDGKPTMSYISEIAKYESIGNPESNKHLVHKVLHRPVTYTDLAPHKNIAHLLFRNKEGKTYEIHTIWQVKQVKNVNFVDTANVDFGVESLMNFNHVMGDLTLNQMGAVKPFFLTSQVKKKFELEEVKPSKEMLLKHGLNPEQRLPPVYAALYDHKGKKVLLTRNSGYSHSKSRDGFENRDFMKYYRALLEEYDSEADVLLLDQTHNGGGSYCVDFFSLFIQEQKPSFVQANNADRRWMRAFNQDWSKEIGATADMVSYMSHEVERAIDMGQPLSSHLPIFGDFLVSPDPKYTWKKPMLVLIDELAASCADAFPMLVKRSNVAKLFGNRTVGAGGNVEQVTELNHSGATIRLTRGLFTTFNRDGHYPESGYVENNGVKPDIYYQHNITDARNGFVSYLEKASNAAVAQCARPVAEG